MRRSVIFVSLIFLLMTLTAEADNLEYAGYFKSEVWIKTNNDNSHQFLSSFKNTVDLRMEYKLSESWTFFFHPRYFYDAAYSIRTDSASYFDINQEKMSHTQRTEWLRECYLDYTSDQLDIRLGKQQVVWGQADGMPFLDRVMPFDLSYYWLPDFADIRIPLWMVKVEYSPAPDSTLQFLFIPDFESSRAAPANAPFSFKANNAWYRFKTSINPLYGGTAQETIYRPPKQFKNSRIGLRWRSMIGGLEYTLNWLYGYSTSAYTYTDSFIPIFGKIGHYKVSRRHKLMHIIGFAFNKSFVNPGPLEGWTIRGEFAYFHNEPTYYGIQGSRILTERTDKYAYVLGFDRNFFTNWLFSLQFAQYIHNDRTKNGYQVLNTYTYGVMEKVETILTLKIATDFMHERVKPEALIIYGDDNDGRVSFKTKYEINDNLWLTVGYHRFWGSPYGSNGQFRNNDHLFSKLKYTF